MSPVKFARPSNTAVNGPVTQPTAQLAEYAKLSSVLKASCCAQRRACRSELAVADARRDDSCCSRAPRESLRTSASDAVPP